MLEKHFLAHLRKIKTEIRQILGPDSKGLASYYRAYKRVFRRSLESVRTRDQLLDHGQKSKVVMMGDFHTLGRSQGEALKMAKELFARTQGEMVLVLECFRASAQPWLDQYMAGTLSERDLLDKTAYSERWGFPWRGYQNLLQWAKKEGVKVLALDSTGRLGTRDVRMANRLENSIRRFPDLLHLVLVGDLHLAPGHLPKELLRRFGMRNTNPFLTVIYQNSESVYLRSLARREEPEAVYHLANNRFLIINTSPWTKMASFLTWLEQESASWYALQEDFQDSVLDARLEALERRVESYLQVDLLDQPLHLATSEEAAQLFASAKTKGNKILLSLYHNGHPVILKKEKVLALPRLTFHHMVEGIFQNILQIYLPNPVLERPSSKTFCRLVQFFLAGFTVSKLVTPGRQASNPARMGTMLRKLTHGLGSRSVESRDKAKTIRLALSMIDLIRQGPDFVTKKQLQDFVRQDRKMAHEATILMAYHLGDRLFSAHRRGWVVKEDLRYLLLFGSNDPLAFFHRILTGLRLHREPWPDHKRDVPPGDCRQPKSW